MNPVRLDEPDETLRASPPSFAAGLCWFCATVSAAGTFAAALAWIDAGTAAEPPPARDALLVLSVAAIVAMVVFMAIAFRIEQRLDGAEGR